MNRNVLYHNAGQAAGSSSRGRFLGRVSGPPKAWKSVIAITRFTEGELAEIRLHPITLGRGRPRPRRGRPRLATPERGRAIVEHLADLSRSYGTTVQYRPEENVGVIEVSE